MCVEIVCPYRKSPCFCPFPETPHQILPHPKVDSIPRCTCWPISFWPFLLSTFVVYLFVVSVGTDWEDGKQNHKPWHSQKHGWGTGQLCSMSFPVLIHDPLSSFHHLVRPNRCRKPPPRRRYFATNRAFSPQEMPAWSTSTFSCLGCYSCFSAAS